MEKTQNLAEFTPSGSYPMSMTAAKPSLDERERMGASVPATRVNGGTPEPRQAGVPGSDRLARLFMRSQRMDLETGTRRPAGGDNIDGGVRVQREHNAAVPTQAEEMLAAAYGDVSSAFAIAVAKGDWCVAATFLEAGADALQVAKGFVDHGQWSNVLRIIQQRLFSGAGDYEVYVDGMDRAQWDEMRLTIGDGRIRRLEDERPVSEVIAYALEATDGPDMDWIKRVCSDVLLAGEIVASHFKKTCDLTALMTLAHAQSISAPLLIDAVANMPDLDREDRVSAIARILAAEYIPAQGVLPSKHALYQQLQSGRPQVLDLMIAGGVGWDHALFRAGFDDDISAIKCLLKCDGVQVGTVLDALLAQKSLAGKTAIAYSMMKHYALEEHTDSLMKFRELKFLLNTRGETRRLFRYTAAILLQDEIKAGNAHAVAILMAAGVALNEISDLDGLANPSPVRMFESD